MSRRTRRWACGLAVTALLGGAALASAPPSSAGASAPPSSAGASAPPSAAGAGPRQAAALAAEREAARGDLRALERRYLRVPGDDRLFADAAVLAWGYLRVRGFQRTGLIPPVDNYSIATVWDAGSMLAAIYCAHELGLLPAAEYEARARAMLRSLQRVELYDDALFNRAYDTRNGAMIRGRPGTPQMAGWSAIDLGRLLIWLRIVGTRPSLAADAEAVVARLDLGRVVRDGYLWGLDIDPLGKPFTYQEGRIGYEQYAAHGLALWGARADKALRLEENAVPIAVMGHEVPADLRRWDRLTNEPFLLLGLELGWDRPTAQVVRRLVLSQEARARKTGRLTLTGEDAIAQPPHYFYYYCVYANGKEFGVDVQDRHRTVDGPRWISAKSAFALHALMPTAYSGRLLQSLDRARRDDGWASGVFEADGSSTSTPNINTAAVILSAALVHQRGEAILPQALRAAGAADARSGD